MLFFIVIFIRENEDKILCWIKFIFSFNKQQKNKDIPNKYDFEQSFVAEISEVKDYFMEDEKNPEKKD